MSLAVPSGDHLKSTFEQEVPLVGDDKNCDSFRRISLPPLNRFVYQAENLARQAEIADLNRNYPALKEHVRDIQGIADHFGSRLKTERDHIHLCAALGLSYSRLYEASKGKERGLMIASRDRAIEYLKNSLSPSETDYRHLYDIRIRYELAELSRNAGRHFSDVREPQEACRHFDVAIEMLEYIVKLEIYPGYPDHIGKCADAYMEKASVLLSTGERKEALGCINRAIELTKLDIEKRPEYERAARKRLTQMHRLLDG